MNLSRTLLYSRLSPNLAFLRTFQTTSKLFSGHEPEYYWAPIKAGNREVVGFGVNGDPVISSFYGFIDLIWWFRFNFFHLFEFYNFVILSSNISGLDFNLFKFTNYQFPFLIHFKFFVGDIYCLNIGHSLCEYSLLFFQQVIKIQKKI